MRIALVIEHYDPAGGGAERSLRQTALELVQRGHEVTVVTGSAADGAEDRGVQVRSMASSKSSGVVRLMRFHKWALQELDDGGYDVSLSVTMAVPADVMQPRGGTVRETLARNVAIRDTSLAKLGKAAAIQTDPKTQLLLHLEKQTLRSSRVHKVVALSGYVVRQLDKHYGVVGDDVVLIPNAAVMPTFEPGEREACRAELRHGLGIDDAQGVYLFAALNPRLKGLYPLLAAFEKHVAGAAARRHASPVLLLAGDASPRVLQAVAEAGVRPHVRLMGHTQRMHALYAAADVTVLPTYYDPSSKVVIESLMLGVPAISTSYNGASDWLVVPQPRHPNAEEGAPPPPPIRRGVIVSEPGDVQGLTAAMGQLADVGFRQQCAEACVGLHKELTMKRHVDALEALLLDVSRNRPTVASS